MATEQEIRDALKTVRYPGFSRDIVSFGLVKGIDLAADGSATIHLAVATRDPEIPRLIHEQATKALEALPGLLSATLDIRVQDPPQPGGAAPGVGQSSIPGVRRILAVASGKGGVGKSTVAANLAVALAQAGHRTGLCDCDLYGPSMALMFGIEDQPRANDRDQIIPLEAHGVVLMSMGFLLADTSPVIVRGPVATRYTQQFLRQVAWGDLDYLVLDLPPGTGDIQLTIVQTVALDGAVLVTTPQEVALIDARKAAAMFDKVNVPVLGIVENMSWFECPSDGKRYYLFGRDGGTEEARRLHVPLLGQIPLTEETRAGGDTGRPVACQPPGHPVADAFRQLALTLHSTISSRPA